MLKIEDSLVLIIDIQEKLVSAMPNKEVAIKASKLVDATNLLDIPVLVTEQYPKGLGNSVLELSSRFEKSVKVFEKTCFNALLENDILNEIEVLNRKQIVVCGIETHICVYQTVLALLEKGFEVYIVKDACASRNDFEFQQGLELMKDFGAKISCLEIILFEWLKGAKNPKFKEVQALIK